MAGAKEDRPPGPQEGGLRAGNGISEGAPLPWQGGLGIESAFENSASFSSTSSGASDPLQSAFVLAPGPRPHWPPRKAKTPLVAQAALLS